METLSRRYYKYITQNVFAMIGMSCYIIADTFFISKAAGTDGITVLNLALPLYGVIYAIGAMIGVGAATGYTIAKERNDENYNRYFYNAIVFDLMIGLVITFLGVFCPEKIMRLMGADALIIKTGVGYNRIFLSFAPAFMVNYAFTSFVRNDNDSTLAMCAMIVSCASNILLDYIFMFPLKMGIQGAALATSLAPIISIVICCMHFFKKKNNIKLIIGRPSIRMFLKSSSLGLSSFIGEISSAVTTTVFNYLLLAISGNIAVAAYGVIANFSLVAVSMFNGVAMGSQPLISSSYGKGEKGDVKKLLSKAISTSLILATVVIVAVNVFNKYCIGIFDRDNSEEFRNLASVGLRIYFAGFIFAAINIVCSSYFSATEKVKPAFLISTLRGIALNVLAAIVLSKIIGINGVWLAFPVAEFVTFIVTIICLRLKNGEKTYERNRSSL